MPTLPDLSSCKKIGFIVPSSNTAVEPITTAIFQSLNRNIICLFTRIQVKTVGTDENSISQFTTDTFVEAARLLADAQVDVILWNGTSGMWTGGSLEDEKLLAQAMQDATEIPCSTTTLATMEALHHFDVDMISIAVPYDEALTAKVKDFFSNAGYEVLRAERLENTPSSNVEIVKSSRKDIESVIERAKAGWTQAIVVACTNWPASVLVEDLENELEVLVVDSIIATAWWALRMVGVKGGVREWGQLIDEL